MSYHNEMQIGTHIFRIINRHMDEADGCHHNIMEIMREAFSEDKKIKVFTQPQANTRLKPQDPTPR